MLINLSSRAVLLNKSSSKVVLSPNSILDDFEDPNCVINVDVKRS